MAITLNHSVKETCKFMLSASAEIEYEKDQSYHFILQIVDSQTKNSLASKDTTLNNGKGIAEIDFDYSNHKEDGISINVIATITKLPSPEPQPAHASQPEPESVAAITKNRTIETKSEMYRLFGLRDCLDHIDFYQSCSYSYRPQVVSLTPQPLKALAAIFLQKDYRLISIAGSSVKLAYISPSSESVTPEWDLDIINTLITLETDLQDKELACDFSRFRFEAAALIKHKPSGLILQLPLIIDNRRTNERNKDLTDSDYAPCLYQRPGARQENILRL